MPEVINTDAVYKKLKKQNGEGVARVIRDSALLDVPNIVHVLELSGNKPQEVQQLIPVIREVYKEKLESEYVSDKNPLELLDEAGYDAFVVDSLEKQNSIKKYYRQDEELCTFRDPVRYKNYYMIHAVKRGADKIKPSDNPKRQDEYGTSVISIQIAKTGGFISIKNRYNHTVNNPDATFDNNPDNIIPGLSNALKKYFNNVNFNTTNASLPDNFRMVNDQLVRYEHEVNNTYVGSDHYFYGSTITKLNKDYEVMLDYFVLDLRTGKIRDITRDDDCTQDVLTKLFNGKKIEKRDNPENKQEKIIYADGVKIASVQDGQITELNLSGITEVGNGFLSHNKAIKKLIAPDLQYIGDTFLRYNRALESIDLPKAKKIGTGFLSINNNISSLNLPNVEEIGSFFFNNNKALQSIDLPKVKKIGRAFLQDNERVNSLNLPNVEEVGSGFLYYNKALQSIDLPKVKKIGANFLDFNNNILSINLPNVLEIDEGFLMNNGRLTSLNLPNVRKIGDCFLHYNKELISLDLPKVESIGSFCLAYNREVSLLNLPNVREIGDYFLERNEKLKHLSLPNVEKIGEMALANNKVIETVYLPKIEKLGDYFGGSKAHVLTRVHVPNLSDKRRAKFDELFAAKQRVQQLIDAQVEAAKKELDEMYARAKNKKATINE